MVDFQLPRLITGGQHKTIKKKSLGTTLIVVYFKHLYQIRGIKKPSHFEMLKSRQVPWSRGPRRWQQHIQSSQKSVVCVFGSLSWIEIPWDRRSSLRKFHPRPWWAMYSNTPVMHRTVDPVGLALWNKANCRWNIYFERGKSWKTRHGHRMFSDVLGLPPVNMSMAFWKSPCENLSMTIIYNELKKMENDVLLPDLHGNELWVALY